MCMSSTYVCKNHVRQSQSIKALLQEQLNADFSQYPNEPQCLVKCVKCIESNADDVDDGK